MKPILIVGTIIVHLALISYSIAVFSQIKKKALTKFVMTFLTLGLIFDITATLLMVVGSSKSGLTIHGFIGYSSLLGMLLDTLFSYRQILKTGIGTVVTPKFTRNTTLAYAYWVVAFITGATLVFLSK